MLPNEDGKAKAEPEAVQEPAGTALKVITVFISYAWNPREEEDKSLMADNITPDYETPVDMIYEELCKEGTLLEVLRDKFVLKENDLVMDFINKITTTDKVLIIHSEKYWTSPYCLYEFWKVCRATMPKQNGIAENIILVGLKDSDVFGLSKILYQKYWQEWHDQYKLLWDGKLRKADIAAKKMKSLPVRLEKCWPFTDLFLDVDHIFRNEIPDLANPNVRKPEWPKTPAEQQKLIQWIKEKIGLRPSTPKLDPKA